MHPKRPSFFHLGVGGGVDWVLLQFDVSKCIPYDSFMFPIKCSIVLYYVPNLFLKFPIAAYFIPYPLLPKFLTICVV
jgi:hypothetical protein